MRTTQPGWYGIRWNASNALVFFLSVPVYNWALKSTSSKKLRERLGIFALTMEPNVSSNGTDSNEGNALRHKPPVIEEAPQGINAAVVALDVPNEEEQAHAVNVSAFEVTDTGQHPSPHIEESTVQETPQGAETVEHPTSVNSPTQDDSTLQQPGTGEGNPPDQNASPHRRRPSTYPESGGHTGPYSLPFGPRLLLLPVVAGSFSTAPLPP